MRPPRIHHCTSEPFRFFGRTAELRLLQEALAGGAASVVAFVGPGGQGKTAIVQHFVQQLLAVFPPSPLGGEELGVGWSSGFSRSSEDKRPAKAGTPTDPPAPVPQGPRGERDPSPPTHLSGGARGGRPHSLHGLFLWSFYRGKDADLCLRELFAYAEGLDHLPDVSASFCVDRLLPRLRREQWLLILDGTEVAQHDSGSWRGRLLHPELGRLLEELATEPLPGVVVLTSRFDFPTLLHRPHARLASLAALDSVSAHALLRSLGVHGSDADLTAVAVLGGHHAKAVELLGTYLVRFHQGRRAAMPICPTRPWWRARPTRNTGLSAC